jgi:hypothetical protein
MAEFEPTETTTDDGGELQFDQAEFTPGAAPASPTCAACRRPIADEYYAVGGNLLCINCKARVEAPANFSTKLKRFLLASIYGTGAAVAGFAIYFGVAKLFNIELGLISILVGFMVGSTVRKGTGGHGGWLYQMLAIFLTYSAIAASYGALHLPQVFADMSAQQEKGEEKPGAVAAGKADAPEKKEAKADVEPAPGKDAIVLIAYALFAVAFSYALPIIAGFESPIGLLIVGFALWEAGKLTRRIPLAVTGPYRVAAQGKGSMEDPYDV